MTVFSAPDGQKVHSVTTLNRLARNILTSEIGLVWLSAEISNFTRASSGHWYFTLKDNKAQVRAAMFRSANRVVRNPPREGDKVLVRASVGIYEPRGDYQLVVENMEPEGEGQLKLAFEQLKYKLQAEGLFDPSNKQALPSHVKRIGVITSAHGAALHDVLSVLKRRSPATEVIVYPSMVQGEQAAAQLARNIWLANQRQEVDVILLTRGGGSLEDLWCFNNESLAREIARSALPLVSAVGHEVDVTIADFVADLRAPTPSAAAELLSMDQREIQVQVRQLQQQLTRAFNTALQRRAHQVAVLSQRLKSRHPEVMLQQQGQRVDQLTQKMTSLINQQLSRGQTASQWLESRLARQHPAIQLDKIKTQQVYLDQRMKKAMQQRLETHKQKLATLAHLLQSVSPLATMARGYSATLKADQAITSITAVKEQDEIISRVSDGEIVSVVTAVHAKPTL
ncbi:MAG: exodeoxyribonuclease VII large subunit [Pseudomonadota bacterium]|uniref:Exodeoxyribonuclease 7 large subunit n=1 Tax=Alteromonas oceani TaxID=2071609 RepID=A0ABV7K0M0_9ALTE|nr:exodeoxyribonuclease VII large subunit [Alteromonas oceani]MEC8228809.1 exodeoxyribonuclease VII large subunit [Pseudomonadota bacterium]MEC9263236.1 exodeoxyribonuclease VII large subunit [Pseudomonadota bacterium]